MKHNIHYCSYNSILVLNPKGKLRQVFTPFKVKTVYDNNVQIYIVDEVMTSEDDKLIYIICDKAYYHHHFILDIHF
jgi:hypothetical protein